MLLLQEFSLVRIASFPSPCPQNPILLSALAQFCDIIPFEYGAFPFDLTPEQPTLGYNKTAPRESDSAYCGEQKL